MVNKIEKQNFGFLNRSGGADVNFSVIADQIISSCSYGKVLDIGYGQDELLCELLTHGIDAQAIDTSGAITNRDDCRFYGRLKQGPASDLPFNDDEFQTVVSINCLEQLPIEEIPKALGEIYRVSTRFVFLRLAISHSVESLPKVRDRKWWESMCFSAGFRKHPLYYRVNDYFKLEHDSNNIIIVLEKIPPAALSQYPLLYLQEERDLHMDMMRESGSRSDAHIMRYQLASQYIRPGDMVLDAACGLGYGAHVLGVASKAKSVTGIDSSTYGINYAKANFRSSPLIHFEEGVLPTHLAGIRNCSFDCIVCFETLEHVEDPITLLAEFSRILTPGGRIIASVPNDWSDETGNDPNPYHLHVYDSKKFIHQLAQNFDVEFLIGQTADRIKNPQKPGAWIQRPRSIKNIPLENTAESIEAEWLIAISSKCPLNGETVTYQERVFTDEEIAAGGHALSFTRDYENPWIVRSLISIGLRTENADLRAKWAEGVLQTALPDSADYGAALCILTYIFLERPNLHQFKLAPLLRQYLTLHPKNQNVLRWQISIEFALHILELTSGNRSEAAQHLEHLITQPAADYSSTLLTKTAQAAYLLGLMKLADGEIENAKQIWSTGFHRLQGIMARNLLLPYSTLPATFEMREIASVVSLMGRLCVAAKYADVASIRPTVFSEEIAADDVAQLTMLRSPLRHTNREMNPLLDDMELLTPGKNWLDLQWSHLTEEISNLRTSIGVLQQGKDWLETQWKQLTEENLQHREHIKAILEGKEWLESQRLSLSEAIQQQHAEYLTLLEGKDWLEDQWKNQTDEIARLKCEVASLKNNLAEAREQLSSKKGHAYAKSTKKTDT